MKYKYVYETIAIKQENLYNAIIVNADTRIIVEISFNKDKQKLSVMSTGITPYPLAERVEYFRFILKDRFGNEVINESINSDENADEFKRRVDNEEFDCSDSIELIQYEIGTVKITNYPSLGQVYELKKINEKFIMTNNGLSEYLYPNKIIINNDYKQKVGKIEFDIKNKMLVVTSTETESSSKLEKDEEFLAVIILNGNLNKKYEGNIKGRESAYSFASKLNNKKIINGDIIKIRCKNVENITVTNYRCKRLYKLKKRFVFLKITENNLIPYKLDLLLNSIRIKNKDNSYVVEILFIADNKVLIIDSTGIKNIDSEYFSFKLLDLLGKQQKFLAILNKNETGDVMTQNLDNKKFQDKDVIELSYSDNTLIEITNYPTSKEAVYTPLGNSEKFIITSRGLVGFIIPTKIIIKNINGQIVATIGFNTREKVLKIYATGNVANNNFGNNVYFSLELLDGKTFKGDIGIIKGREDGKKFANKLNNKSFKDGDIIRLTYVDSNKIEITNYPNLEEILYNPRNNKENFTITSDRLKSYPTTLNNNIHFISNNQLIASIMFNTDQNRLIVSSTDKIGKCQSGFGPYLYFEITRNNQTILSNSILCNVTAKAFLSEVDDFSFKYNDEIILRLIIPNKASITNFRGLGNNLDVSNNKLIITPLGLR